MSINIYDKKLETLNSIANETQMCDSNDITDVTTQIADINTKVETNEQDISFIKLNYISKQQLDTCLNKKCI